jgi:bifunctional ADP-heptose synthase (sugar kinase/adenylyltransferase)
VDTRSKILTAAAALEIAVRPLAIVTGTFDVLRAEHARELQKVRNGTGAAAVLAVVLPRAGELLSQRARAELVAALSTVDLVVVVAGPGELDGLIRGLQPAHLIRLEEHDERRLQQLCEHVRRGLPVA